jgi:hypothetical protein
MNFKYFNKYKNLLKKLIKLLLPPIFYPKAFKEIIYSFLKNDQIKLDDTFFKRHAFINKAISKYKNCNYLEIGCSRQDLFNSIPLKLTNKYGVDPVLGGNYKMTSDLFFEKNPPSQIKFDVIFIDGLHHYFQCKRDTQNSINSLNKGGIIFIHDVLPKNQFEEAIPRKLGTWTGDVWKVAVELFNSKNCDFRIINADQGIGILKINEDFKYKDMPELINLKFNDFLRYYKSFNLLDPQEALDYIELL